MRHDLSQIVFGNAAGTIKTEYGADNLARFAESLTRRTIGTITFHERHGNIGETRYDDLLTGGFYNADGFKNPGMATTLTWLSGYQRRCRDDGVELAVSIVDPDPERTAIMAARLRPFCDRIEIDLGYSNLWIGGAHSPTPARHPKLFAAQIDAVGKVLPAFGVKIAPVEDEPLATLMEIVWRKGCVNEVIAANSHGGHHPQRADGTDALRWCGGGNLTLRHKGALSGDPIFEHNLRVARTARKLLTDDIGVVGSGGVTSGAHLLGYLDAEADGVVVGTSIFREGLGALDRIWNEAAELQQ